mgnify:FL=1
MDYFEIAQNAYGPGHGETLWEYIDEQATDLQQKGFLPWYDGLTNDQRRHLRNWVDGLDRAQMMEFMSFIQKDGPHWVDNE